MPEHALLAAEKDVPLAAEADTPRDSKQPEPDQAEMKRWLDELDRLRDQAGDPDEIRVRVLEHIEMAEVALGLRKRKG